MLVRAQLQELFFYYQVHLYPTVVLSKVDGLKLTFLPYLVALSACGKNSVYALHCLHNGNFHEPKYCNYFFNPSKRNVSE